MDRKPKVTLVSERPALAVRFQVLKLLGRGAAGAVYLVRDKENDNQEVALKVLTDKDAFDENTQERFFEEIRICQTLKHPNIIEAFELIETDDAVSYTMEYIEGSDLRVFLDTEQIADEIIDSIFAQLLSALDFLHRQGIIHRDIKLENILIDKEGNVKLTDLGLVKNSWRNSLTRTGVRLGTLQYMPPEYIRRGQYDERSDIYCVGIVLYEVLTGKRRLADTSGNEALEYLIKTKFKVPSIKRRGVSRRYHQVINKAMDPSPRRRFQQASEMREFFVNPTTSVISKLPDRSRIDTGHLLHVLGCELRRLDTKFIAVAFSTALLFAIVIFFLFRGARLGELKPGKYCGYANEVVRKGSLDKFGLKIGGKKMLISLAGKICDVKSSSGKSFGIVCLGKNYQLLPEKVSEDGLTGVLLNTDSSEEHSFYLEDCR